MRFEGTDTSLMVLPHADDGTGDEDFEAAFKRVYKSEFGFLLETKTVIVDDIKVCYFWTPTTCCLRYCNRFGASERLSILSASLFTQKSRRSRKRMSITAQR